MAAALGAGAPANYHALIFGFNTADTAPLGGSVTGTPGYDAQTHLTAFPCADPGSFTAADVGKWASFDNGPWLQIVAVSGDIIYVAGDFAGVTGIAGDLLISRHPHSTGGQLTTALAYSSGVTTLEDAAAQFAPYMVGWQVMLNPAQPVLRTISAVPSATQLQFAGDGVNLAAAGDFYRVFAPPGVMADANGALWTEQVADARFAASNVHLWGGLRYVPPQTGILAAPGGNLSIYGGQSGPNQTGAFAVGSKVYNPTLGRFQAGHNAAQARPFCILDLTTWTWIPIQTENDESGGIYTLSASYQVVQTIPKHSKATIGLLLDALKKGGISSLQRFAAIDQLLKSGNPTPPSTLDMPYEPRQFIKSKEYRAYSRAALTIVCDENENLIRYHQDTAGAIGYTPIRWGPANSVSYSQGTGKVDTSSGTEGNCAWAYVKVWFRLGSILDGAQFLLTGRGAPYAWNSIYLKLCCNGTKTVNIQASNVPLATVYEDGKKVFTRTSMLRPDVLDKFIEAGNLTDAPGGFLYGNP